ncbi:MAG TPA: LytTR family DNA-binding domain-containing protein [Burkholderiaceae bacterium]|nr:LytTR family DNA-binding domain-containing protein [Burkholderiaceae bacterium]
MKAPAPLRVLIVDDEPPARARLVMLLTDLRERVANEVVGEASHAREALQRLQDLRPDLVIVDIQMPGMTGIEFARRVRQFADDANAARPDIVFCTAFDEYAVQAFEVQAVDYLLKPVKSARLLDALERAWARRMDREQAVTDESASKARDKHDVARRHFTVNERGRVLLVPIDEVIYLKAEMKYTTVRTREREYLIEESLTALEDEFAHRFVRVHRNALVAREAIAGYERGGRDGDDDGNATESEPGWRVVLKGIDESLPVSRRQWPVVKALFVREK